METIHLLISGKVQGVFFRATAKKIAVNLNITGWIKNTEDKKVEALLSGESTSLKEFIEWCKKGPDKAVVQEVSIQKADYQTFSNFQIIR